MLPRTILSEAELVRRGLSMNRRSAFLAGLSAVISFVSLDAFAQVPPDLRPSPADAKSSVVIASDNRVTFNLYPPDAHAVTVDGDFLPGRTGALSNGTDGFWLYTTDPLSSDSYTYIFTVDGV